MEATHSTTIDMYEPEYDDHNRDYEEEAHEAKCRERDIDQGILSEEEEEEWKVPHTL